MIRSFADRGTDDVFDGTPSKNARRSCPADLWPIARRKLDQLNQAESLDDLGVPLGNRLEKLRGDRRREHSVRINDRYRLCFRWTERGPEHVEIVDYHA